MLDYLEKGASLFKFDITQGYHHIDIFEDQQQYLGFSWKFDGTERYFVFTVLPFGLSSGQFIFTKIMRYLLDTGNPTGLGLFAF